MKINKGILSEEIDGEVLLYDSNIQTFYKLNRVGSRIWELINQKKSVNQIKKKILYEYESEKEDVEKDLRIFIKLLFEKKLLI